MVQNKIFIGNLSFKVDERDLEDAFSKFGEIEHVAIPKDRDSGRPKGFAFITFGSDESAQKALSMHDQEIDGRKISVSIAKERPQNKRSFGERSFSSGQGQRRDRDQRGSDRHY